MFFVMNELFALQAGASRSISCGAAAKHIMLGDEELCQQLLRCIRDTGFNKVDNRMREL